MKKEENLTGKLHFDMFPGGFALIKEIWTSGLQEIFKEHWYSQRNPGSNLM